MLGRSTALALWQRTLDVLYPPMCCVCSAPMSYVGFCAPCLSAIVTPRSPLCSTCGIPFAGGYDTDHRCAHCLTHSPRFRQARAGTIYDAAAPANHPLKAALQRYKYTGDVSLAPVLATLLRDKAPQRLSDYDVIIPVPLHLERLRWRGFNQALLLARHLADAASLPIDAFALQRTRPTRPQVELDEGSRRDNVAGAFQVIRPNRVSRRRILLVDDVYTTGSTVNECSAALRRAGAHSVDVLVLARAVLR